MKKTILQVALVAGLTAFSGNLKADSLTNTMISSNAIVVSSVSTPAPAPGATPTATPPPTPTATPTPPAYTNTLYFSTPSFNTAGTTGSLVFQYNALTNLQINVAAGTYLNILGVFSSTNSFGITNANVAQISFTGVSGSLPSVATFYGYINQNGITLCSQVESSSGRYSFTGIQVAIPVTGTGTSYSFGTNNILTPFELSTLTADSNSLTLSTYTATSDTATADTATAGSASPSYTDVVTRSGGTAPLPEPSTYALFGIGAVGLLMVLRRKKTA